MKIITNLAKIALFFSLLALLFALGIAASAFFFQHFWNYFAPMVELRTFTFEQSLLIAVCGAIFCGGTAAASRKKRKQND